MSLTTTEQPTQAIAEPEHHVLPPTKYVPNNPMPILIYRNVLPYPRDEQTVRAFIEKHGWDRKGIVWPAIYKRHFHPNTHECYAILSGSSRVLMGVGTSDDTEGREPDDVVSKQPGLIFTLREGDVIVHPAGTSHSNISDEGHYRYLSFFPSGAPKWISLNGDSLLDLETVRAQTMGVPMPEDPVIGGDGHLIPFWTKARDAFLEGSGNWGRDG